MPTLPTISTGRTIAADRPSRTAVGHHRPLRFQSCPRHRADRRPPGHREMGGNPQASFYLNLRPDFGTDIFRRTDIAVVRPAPVNGIHGYYVAGRGRSDRQGPGLDRHARHRPDNCEDIGCLIARCREAAGRLASLSERGSHSGSGLPSDPPHRFHAAASGSGIRAIAELRKRGSSVTSSPTQSGRSNGSSGARSSISARTNPSTRPAKTSTSQVLPP